MAFSHAGELCALGSAVAWALALVLFQRSGQQVAPVPLNTFKNLVGLALLCGTLLITQWAVIAAVAADPAHLRSAWSPRLQIDLLQLTISGILGIAIADTLLFRGLNLIGVGLTAIADCMYTPFAVLWSAMLLGATLTGWQYVGAALILVAVLLSSQQAPPANRTRAELTIGMLLTGSAMALMTFAIIWVKPVLERWDTLSATAVRLAGGAGFLVIVGGLTGHWTAIVSALRPSRTWLAMFPAAVLGAYISLVLWIAGFKYSQQPAVAAVLNQTSTIFAFVLAAMLLGERMGWRKIAGLAMALLGVAVVTLKRPQV